MRRSARAWLACVILALPAACGVTDDDPPRTDDGTLAYIKSLAFSPGSIEDHGEFLLVDGDIMFSRERPAAGRTSRQGYNNDGLIGYLAVTDVTVAVDDTIPVGGVDDWRAAVQQAIADWNGVGGARLHFTYTTDLAANVIVRSAPTGPGDPLQNNVIAAGEFPAGGQPGFQIRVNLVYNFNQTVPAARSATTWSTSSVTSSGCATPTGADAPRPA